MTCVDENAFLKSQPVIGDSPGGGVVVSIAKTSAIVFVLT